MIWTRPQSRTVSSVHWVCRRDVTSEPVTGIGGSLAAHAEGRPYFYERESAEGE